MRTYETLLLLSPELNDSERATVVDLLRSTIERENGSVVTVDDWGMRDLAYPVKKVMRGWYLRIEYGLQPLAVQELERIIRLNENIFKFITVKLADAVAA